MLKNISKKCLQIFQKYLIFQNNFELFVKNVKKIFQKNVAEDFT